MDLSVSNYKIKYIKAFGRIIPCVIVGEDTLDYLSETPMKDIDLFVIVYFD